MSGYLLDTNVVSELTKLRPESKVVSWFQATSEELLYLSVFTIGEIRKGIDKGRNIFNKSKARLRPRLRDLKKDEDL